MNEGLLFNFYLQRLGGVAEMLHQVSESHCNLGIKNEYMWE